MGEKLDTHGKRSGSPGLDLGSTDTQWFISRLAPRQLQAQWFPKVPQESNDEQRRSQGINVGEASLILSADTDLSEDVMGADDKQVIIMEQPPRLYKILDHLPNKMERK